MIALVFSLLAMAIVAKDWKHEFNTLDFQRYGSMLDNNADYMLDIEELRQIPRQLLNGRDIAQLLDTYDTNGDGMLSFAEFTAAGNAMAVHPVKDDLSLSSPSFLDTASESQSQLRAAARTRMHAHAQDSSNQLALSRILAPKGDCCFRDEVAFNGRCYPACKSTERIVSDKEKVYCADKNCPSQSICKVIVTDGYCASTCVHCTKTCPPGICSTDFCTANAQYGCWYQPPQSDGNSDYLCDTGNFVSGVYYEQPIPERLNLPIGDPRSCSQVYWSDDTLKPRGA